MLQFWGESTREFEKLVRISSRNFFRRSTRCAARISPQSPVTLPNHHALEAIIRKWGNSPALRLPMSALKAIDSVASAVLSDQVKSLDWKVRYAKKKGTVPGAFMSHVRAKIKALPMMESPVGRRA